MTDEIRDGVAAYLKKVEGEWRTGQATEHTYRPMLKALLEAMLPKVMVLNEPARIACGAPDYIIQDAKSGLPLGFVEAKDIADADLDGKSAHKEQFSRYKDSLETICFTDYLDFHFYSHDTFLDSVRIGEIKGERIASADDAALERFANLIGRFAEVRPQRIASPARLAQLMAGKARFLAQSVRQYLESDAHADSTLAQQMAAFRQVLIHDIDAASFADIFAQTVTYGLFAARLHDTTSEDFSRAEAAKLIPKTNPLLRQMFQYIALDSDDSIEWIIDDLASLFGAVDVERLMRDYGKATLRTDPLLHFYEDFLAAYDSRLRKARGVWYTPAPVVDFIVRAVDTILTRDFALPGGIADATKVTVEFKNDFKKTLHSRGKSIVHQDVHRVQILDPAAGTGTFLATAVKRIHEKVVASMGEGAWQGYVSADLLPRLNGFEILMASYAMAHLKLDMLLAETGYVHASDERLRVFLTNSLEPFDRETGLLFAAALAQEANEANFIKRDCPVMVVMGNPPYAVSSSNKGEWIQAEIDEYKKDLNEKHILLDDDYIKFIRLGQHYVEKNGEGILAYISNNSFIDGITHRQMRKSLLKTFDEIYILNLHGSSKLKEKTPDGGKDENVFDIMQGVSINIFVKRKGAGRVVGRGVPTAPQSCTNENGVGTGLRAGGTPAPTGVVRYADLYGLREQKYDFLEGHGLDTIEWKTLEMQEPYYFFVPKDFGLQDEYEKGFRIDELMPISSTGVQTSRDELTVASNYAELYDRFKQVSDPTMSTERLRALFFGSTSKGSYPAGDSSFWQFEQSRQSVMGEVLSDNIHAFSYRPFDSKYIYYSSAVIHRPRKNVFNHFLMGNNLGVIICRQGQVVGSMPWNVVFVTDKISDLNMFYRGGGCTFPLYLYEENMGVVEKRPNFDVAIYGKICSAVQPSTFNLQPLDIFHYIYGVLHTPAYRERYREFLKIDFPRIPYPKSGEEFRRVAAIGAKLVAVHLLKDPDVTNPFANPYAKFEGAGDGVVEKVEGCPSAVQPSTSNLQPSLRVYINGTQYFAPVPEAAWSAYIGGYQPAQKWLKDRKGRALTADDLTHYRSIIAALVQTAELMSQL